MTVNNLNKAQCLSVKCLWKPAIAVAVVAVLGVGGYMLFSGKSAKTAETAIDAPAVVDGEEVVEVDVIETPSGQIVQGNPVVARVGDTEILRSEVLELITALPDHMRTEPLDVLFPMALEQVVNNQIISQKAENAGLEDDAEVTKAMEMAKAQIIRGAYVQREVNKAVTEAKLKAEYDSLVKQLPEVPEIKARHILVETEEKAKELVTKLDQGADFETLSRENSTGVTATNGGDLGYFGRGDMIPEFSEAAFALKKGEYTSKPVKTQFGWHLIEVEDKRNRPVPTFDEVKPQVEAKLRQEELARMVKQWQEQSKIERFDINGKPVVAPAE